MRSEVDLHIHSMRSPDSLSRPERILKRAREVGLAAIAVTDHNSWEGTRDARSVSGATPLIVPGAELRTVKGDLLALFVEEPIRERDWAGAIDSIRAQGGLAIVPHPSQSRALTDDDLRMADALEAFNSRCGRDSNERAKETARRLGLPGIGSSDAHMVAAIGIARTSVPEFETVEELRRVLLSDPVVSRADRTNPLLRYGNAALCFGLKGAWMR